MNASPILLLCYDRGRESVHRMTLFLVLLIINACGRPSSKVLIVSNENEFKSAIQKISAGDTLIIKNGTYYNWSVSVPVNGTPDSIITIRPEKEHGVL